MIKFIYKKHVRENDKSGKVVIYYNVSEVLLGIALLMLVVFFINDYLSHAFTPKNNMIMPTTNKAMQN